METPIAASAARDDGSTTVAFLGPFTSYSHQATKLAFPDEEKWVLQPTGTIKEVFDRVQSTPTRYGVVPFENSTHGTVTFTLDCLADRASEYPDIAVCGEVYLDVHHFLLGRFPPSSPPSREGGEEKEPPNGHPLVPLDHVKRVYSHPQAFGQTAAFARRHLKGAETIDVSSTSRAAELAAADGSGASAAIAGEMAGRARGLDVLARCIEDRADNTTRFLVLQRRADPAPATQHPGLPFASPGAGGGDAYGGRRYKSLVSFTVAHGRPGALADVLDCFRTRSLNLTSISSVPSLVGPFQYLFFVEFEGSRFDDPEGRVNGVFEDLTKVAERWRWLGSWRNRREK
ncbi:P-protein [Madurella mycetomatis]|uniref:prephenate dehydratase n=1 Tax=Madurella mycetomatis TaxID=100816 RepID=A0A175WAL0_9PEZI|nr:P-protein [Madurella mycetomatis]